MKQPSRALSTVLLVLLVSLVVGCASTPQHESTGEYFDDATITGKVKVAIFNDPTLKTSEINVETFKGIVQLSGFVGNRADIPRATEVAWGVKGVQSVKNDLLIK